MRPRLKMRWGQNRCQGVASGCRSRIAVLTLNTRPPTTAMQVEEAAASPTTNTVPKLRACPLVCAKSVKPLYRSTLYAASATMPAIAKSLALFGCVDTWDQVVRVYPSSAMADCNVDNG